MKSLRFRTAVLLLALFVSGPALAQVVISQVYGGGGNSGATWRSDFVELHNNGTGTVSLDGWSLQYASAAGSSWQVTPLSGSIGPGGYYLVKQADGAGGTVDLPTPDATGTIAMSGTAGKVALSNTGSALSGTCPTGNVDFVGYGGSASCAEGGSPTAAPSNTLAVLRADNGCRDTDNNGADFATATPAPRNSASSALVCGGGGQPVLTVSDVALAEGDSGSKAFVFFLSLNMPAGAGGVSFDIATRDGSATAGSDYQALASARHSIAEGQTSLSVSVQVLGDTANEPDETFFLDVTDVSGALPGTLQATGTILNDDFNLIPIHAIQGPGNVSPLVGQVVATSGIVTARRSAGFFLQTPDAEADSDARTSEGIYVYTGSEPPAAAAVGNHVRVRGSVVEYVPSADPTQPPLTEIGGSVTVLLQSSGHALPAPVALSPSFPDPEGDYDQLERLEGMRVTAAGLVVNTPTLGNVNESSATGTSNGVFHAVVAGVPRAWRKPGVQQPDPLPAGSPADVPRWNTNPQVIAVGSAGLGGPRVDVAAGCRIGAVTGPLDYSFRRYTLYPESELAVDCDGADQPKPALAPQADDVSLATYNMERFFDDQNDPAIGEPVLTPAAYQMRLGKASLTVRDYLHLPDILGAVEVESQSVLQTLADRINADAVAAGQPNPQYVAYLQEGNDVGGIDVGFLVKTAAVGADRPRVEVLSVVQHGKATTWVEPGGATSLLNDRPPLLLKAVVHFADGRSLPLTAIVVHQRSLNGAEADTASGERIRAKRQAQAKFLAELVQARQLADPSEKLLLMGDFNAFEFNDGYVDALGTVTGLPSPDAQTVVAGDGADLVDPDLYNLTLMASPDQSYSYAYDGNVQSLDHILANRALMQSPQIANVAVSHARVNADFPQIARNQADSPLRLSDHDPTVVLLKLKSLRVADLGLAAHAAANEVMPGQPIVFTVDVENRGPDAAESAAVALLLNRPLTAAVAAAPGWNCAPPQVTTSTRIVCTVAHFAAGAAQSFSVSVPSDAIAAGSVVQLAASVASQTPDGNQDNNTDVVAVTVVAPAQANLSVRIDGPATLPFYALSADYRISVRNLGTVAAQRPVLEVDSNTWKLLSSLQGASGWQCQKLAQGGLHQARFRCTLAGALTPGASAQFTLRANAIPAPDGGRIQVNAAVRSATPDSDATDNQAAFATRIACGFWGC